MKVIQSCKNLSTKKRSLSGATWYFKGKLYVPSTHVNKVLAALHDDMYSGMHLGLKKTLSKVGQKFTGQLGEKTQSSMSPLVRYVRRLNLLMFDMGC